MKLKINVVLTITIVLRFKSLHHSASSTGQVALVSAVPLTHVLAVGEGVEAGVTLMRRHPVAEAAALLALTPELVAVCLSQVGAVVEHVVAGVGGGGGQALAEATALGAVVFDVILVTRLLREVPAVGEHVIAGLLGCERGVGGAGGGLAVQSHNALANAAHPHAALDPNITILSPALSPGVLHQPVVLASNLLLVDEIMRAGMSS